MAELADALDLGSSAVKGVQVQILFPAPAARSLGCARDFGSGLQNALYRRERRDRGENLSGAAAHSSECVGMVARGEAAPQG